MDTQSPLFGETDPSFSYDVYLPSMDANVDPLNMDVDIDYLAEESSTSTNTTLPPPNLSLASPVSTFASTSTLATISLTQAQQQALVPRRGLVAGDSYGSGRGAEGAIVRLGGSPPSGGSGSGSASAASKQRMERRGHTKSRRGCFNCKRRRIKCQETKPACGHCSKGGLKCEYPSVPLVVHQPQHQIPLFSLQDMRFFQHFLTRGLPYHPIGSENLWKHEIPCLSEKYEYLMHALLGLAASELTSDDPRLVTPAIEHRVKAIRAVKRALGEAPKTNTFEEGNALMATCFALTLQSVLVDDGMAEYMTFIRGILIVAVQMYTKGAKLLFGDVLSNKAKDALEPYMAALPLVEQRWVEAAAGAIQGLRPLCRNATEIRYWELIMDMTEQLRVSSWEGYLSMGKHYGWWMMLPHEEFQRLIDPTRQTSVLLASHWIALKQIMAIITDTESRASKEHHHLRENDKGGDDRSGDHDVGRGLIRWLQYLNGMVDAEHTAYNVWPSWVAAELERDPAAFGRTTS
ncbi:hypothetical protein QBC39DRAFT_174625 [Podospora conica]|nr:hypothetical protein QBC39DRAFT_174625 [Schizothecium conicum]